MKNGREFDRTFVNKLKKIKSDNTRLLACALSLAKLSGHASGNARHQSTIKIFNLRKKHLKNPPHFSQRDGFFPSFLDFV